jgi:hypothetical protein
MHCKRERLQKCKNLDGTAAPQSKSGRRAQLSLLSYSAANDGIKQGAITKVEPLSAHSCVPRVLRVRSEPNHPGVDDAPGCESVDSLICKKSALAFGRRSAQLGRHVEQAANPCQGVLAAAAGLPGGAGLSSGRTQ